MASRSKKQTPVQVRRDERRDPPRPAGSDGRNKPGIPGARPFAKGELDYDPGPGRKQ